MTEGKHAELSKGATAAAMSKASDDHEREKTFLQGIESQVQAHGRSLRELSGSIGSIEGAVIALEHGQKALVTSQQATTKLAAEVGAAVLRLETGQSQIMLSLNELRAHVVRLSEHAGRTSVDIEDLRATAEREHLQHARLRADERKNLEALVRAALGDAPRRQQVSRPDVDYDALSETGKSRLMTQQDAETLLLKKELEVAKAELADRRESRKHWGRWAIGLVGMLIVGVATAIIVSHLTKPHTTTTTIETKSTK